MILLLALLPAVAQLTAWGQAPPVDAGALVARGVELARQGQHDAAGELFRRALAADPDHRDAHYNLALAYYNSGRHSQALREFEAVLAAEPRALDARKGLGLTQLALNRWADAAASLRAVVDATPGDAVAQAALGRAYMGAGNPRRALDPLREAVALQPAEAGFHYELGRAEAAVGNHEAAKRAFARALALKPGSAPAALGLARARLATGEVVLAAEALRPFAELPVPDPVVLTLLAETYDRLKLADEALVVRARLADQLPAQDAVRLRLRIAQAYADRRRWEEALAQFSAAAATDPGRAEAFVGLARCYQALGRSEEEVAAWRAAGELAPGNPEVWLGLATALLAAWKHPEALDALDRALQADPGHRGSLEMAAETAHLAGQADLVVAYRRRLLALDPADIAARFALADALVAHGQPVKALVEAAEALRRPDPPPEAFIKVAYLAEQVGNPELAATHWRRLMERGGEHHVPAGLELGRLLVQLGRASEAVALYRGLIGRRGDEPPLVLGLAAAWQAVGMDREAAEVLGPLVTARPKLTAARVALAESLSWLGEHEAARGEMEQVLAAGPPDERACRALVLVHERAGRPDEAVAALERLLPVGGPQEVILDLLATLYRRTGQVEQGAKRLVEVMQRHPEHPLLGLTAAQLLAEAGSLDAAERLLWELAERREGREAALRKLALLHLAAGAPTRALAPLRQLAEGHIPAAGVIAMLAEMEPRPDLAESAAETLTALARAPSGSPAFWLAAADLAHLMGRGTVEQARLQALHAQAPADPAFAVGLAALALHRDEPALAERTLSAVPPAAQADRALLHTLARAQAAQGRHEAALASLARIMGAMDPLPTDHMAAAALLEVMGRHEEALWQVVCALRLDPSHAPAQQAFREIIGAAPLAPSTLLEALQQLHAARPDARIVFDLADLLSRRPDAQEMTGQWLMHTRMMERPR